EEGRHRALVRRGNAERGMGLNADQVDAQASKVYSIARKSAQLLQGKTLRGKRPRPAPFFSCINDRFRNNSQQPYLEVWKGLGACRCLSSVRIVRHKSVCRIPRR